MKDENIEKLKQLSTDENSADILMILDDIKNDANKVDELNNKVLSLQENNNKLLNMLNSDTIVKKENDQNSNDINYLEKIFNNRLLK